MSSLEAELKRSHEAEMPTPETLSPEQRQALDAAVAALSADLANVRPWEVLKFLTPSRYDVAAAVAAYRRMRAWRAEQKIDTIASEVIPQKRLIEMCSPSTIRGRDRDGRPIYFEKTGRVHAAELVGQVDFKQFERLHVQGLEAALAQMEANERELGRPVRELTAVLDLSGLGPSHLRAMAVLQSLSAIKDSYYPERLAKIFVINAPWIFPTIFSSIKSWLSFGVMSRAYVVHDVAELHAHIAPDQLPREYGGTLDWTLPLFTAEDVRALLLSDPTVLTHEYIPAGGEFVRRVPCEAGAEFLWNFAVDAGYDVGFSIACLVEGKPPVFIKPDSRCGQSKGAYTAVETCELVARFDNTFSYFNGKNLSYHCSARARDAAE